MEARIVKSSQYSYHEADWDGVNASGYRILGDRILVLLDVAPDQTKGGIIVTGTSQETQQMAAETGVIVAMGAAAFTWSADRIKPFGDEKPKVGDRVYFERYAGQYLMGADERMYRAMDDKCVSAVRDSAAFNKKAK